jgi:uncharacterized protein YndB with AHSA1/START domain/predicted enzyme related to lactoylglutathione lyase
VVVFVSASGIVPRLWTRGFPSNWEWIVSNVRGIGGIFFKAKNPKELTAWYERHLGMTDTGYGVVFGWRELNRPERVGQTVWSPFTEDTSYFEPSPASWMINYRVDDIDATLARLATEGVEVLEDREDADYGRFGWVIDPEGNKVELWEPPAEISENSVPAPREDARPGVQAAPPGTEIAARDDLSARSIVVERSIGLPLADIWHRWTTSEGIARWWAPENKIELRIGGPMELYFLRDGAPGLRGSEGCRIVSFLPQRMLSFTWNAPPHLARVRPFHTHVVIEFESESEESTTVRLHHLGWPDRAWDDEPQWAACFAYFENAWPRVLDQLASTS